MRLSIALAKKVGIVMNLERSHRYYTPYGIRQWMRVCDFERHEDAAKALGCNLRTWFRWLEKGLPSGLYGDLLVKEMRYIWLKIHGVDVKLKRPKK